MPQDGRRLDSSSERYRRYQRTTATIPFGLKVACAQPCENENPVGVFGDDPGRVQPMGNFRMETRRDPRWRIDMKGISVASQDGGLYLGGSLFGGDEHWGTVWRQTPRPAANGAEAAAGWPCGARRVCWATGALWDPISGWMPSPKRLGRIDIGHPTRHIKPPEKKSRERSQNGPGSDYGGGVCSEG